MPEQADLDFLDDMKLQATLHAESLHSKDHWAKPFYSDVNLFKPNVRRVFLGLNSKGDRFSHKYDKQQKNEQRVWSGNKPLHNAYLDECWGNHSKSPTPKGEADLQIAVLRVFEAMYGTKWKSRLRNTPCLNLIPVSSNGTSDPKLDKIWDVGVDWSVELLEYLKPQFIILYGNGKSDRSVWTVLKTKFELNDCEKTTPLHFGKHSIKQGVLANTPLNGVPVLALPHLSYVKGKNLDTLCNELRSLRQFRKHHPHPSLPPSRGKGLHEMS